MLRTLILSSAILLSGCALSPQYVDLKPQLEIQQQGSRSRPIEIHIKDARPVQTLGSRGGVYTGTSLIHLSTPLENSLKPIAEHALRQLGYAPVNQGGAVQLTLAVEELTYQASSKTLPPVDVTVKSVVKAQSRNGNQTREARFNSEKTHRFLKSPSPEENERIINEVLTQSLNRLFNDPSLLGFLSQ